MELSFTEMGNHRRRTSCEGDDQELSFGHVCAINILDMQMEMLNSNCIYRSGV